jgi:hypothetical protein
MMRSTDVSMLLLPCTLLGCLQVLQSSKGCQAELALLRDRST